MTIIYKITNDITTKSYIGQTKNSLNQRWSAHCFDAFTKKSPFKFYRSLRKHGKECWSLEILEEINDERLVNEQEKFWIKHFNTFQNGYNSTDGGKSEYVFSEEVKKKIFLSFTEEKRQKYSNAMKIKATTNPAMLERYERMKGSGNHNFGKHLSVEEKENIRKHHLGKVNSPETRHKQSISKIGYRNPNFGKKDVADHLNLKFKCFNCGAETNKGNLARWHNEKCKIVNRKFSLSY